MKFIVGFLLLFSIFSITSVLSDYNTAGSAASLLFDGSTTYVNVDTYNPFYGLDYWSITVWYRCGGNIINNPFEGPLFSSYQIDPPVGTRLLFGHNTTALSLQYIPANGGEYGFFSDNFPDTAGEYAMATVAVNVTARSVQFYINQNAVGTRLIPSPGWFPIGGASRFCLGATAPSSNLIVAGSIIDSVYLWSTTLTSFDVNNYYMNPPISSSPSLMHGYLLRGQYFNSIYDKNVQNKNSTLVIDIVSSGGFNGTVVGKVQYVNPFTNPKSCNKAGCGSTLIVEPVAPGGGGGGGGAAFSTASINIVNSCVLLLISVLFILFKFH